MKKLIAIEAFTLKDFVRESNAIEGILRDPTRGEIQATEKFLSGPLLVTSLIDLVAVYQPGARPRFAEGMDVIVGYYTPPRGGAHIHGDLLDLLARVRDESLTPYRAHLAYEALHPFTDGNGRSGRALWLYMMDGIQHAPLGFLHHFYYQALRGK